MKQFVLSLLFALVSIYSGAQDVSLYQKKLFINHQDTMPYRILYPENYDRHKEYPLFLFLHGSGERGRDNEAQLVHGSQLFLRDSIRKKYPAIILFPQCSESSYWSDVDIVKDSVGKILSLNFPTDKQPTQAMRTLQKLVKFVQRNESVDSRRIYVGGLSMGGMGTFELVRRMPKKFAAAISICGGANPDFAKKMKRPNWRIYHGMQDDVVDYKLSEYMANAINAANGRAFLKLFPAANHNSWDPTFAESDLLQWLFSNKK